MDNTFVKDVKSRLEKYNNQAVLRFQKKSKECMNESEILWNEFTSSYSDSTQRWIDDNCNGKITTNKCLLYKASTEGIEDSKVRKVCRESDIFKISSKSKNYRHCNEKTKKSSFNAKR